MASPPTNLHFVLFPWAAQGHLIPMVDIARMLAQRGTTITIITTPVNTNRIKHIIDRAIEANLKIQVVNIQFPFAKAGLPEGCESYDMLTSVAQVTNMFLAMKLLEEPAEEKIRVLNPPPSCIISDGGFPWSSDIAKRLNIPRIVFYGTGSFASLCLHLVNNTNILDEIKSDSDYFALPGLPDQIQVTKPQAVSWGKGNTKETQETFERTQEAEKSSLGIVVNSFEELEPKYVEEFSKATNKKVWCIGPVSLRNKSLEDIAERGTKAPNNDPSLECLKWLDSRESGSVVYVCFGSLASGWAEQAIELALGLESSNVPFVWVVRRTSDEFERWVLEQQYEERIKDRGLMVRGWAPQIMILAHQAVGGFMTHCGWNSILECVCAGLPMATWPHFAEQFLNERLIVDVLKIGVKIGAEVPITYRGKLDLMVRSEAVKTCVKSLMGGEDEALTIRKRANELGVMAKRAMEEGGSSHLNMTLMIQAITEELAKTNKPVN